MVRKKTIQKIVIYHIALYLGIVWTFSNNMSTYKSCTLSYSIQVIRLTPRCALMDTYKWVHWHISTGLLGSMLVLNWISWQVYSSAVIQFSKYLKSTDCVPGPQLGAGATVHFIIMCFVIVVKMIGEGNGNPLQCSCLENPRDGGAWWAAVYGVAQSRTRLKQLSSSSSSSLMSKVKAEK